MSSSPVPLVSVIIFLIYLRVIWPTFNTEESQVYVTENLLSSNKTFFGLSGADVLRLHQLTDWHVNQTYERLRMVDVSEIREPLSQIKEFTESAAEQPSVARSWIGSRNRKQFN